MDSDNTSIDTMRLNLLYELILHYSIFKSNFLSFYNCLNDEEIASIEIILVDSKFNVIYSKFLRTQNEDSN